MLTLILAVIAGLVVRAVVVLVSPTRKCTRCKGERVTRNRWNNRITGCPRCKGTGRHHRLGAVIAARAWWSLRGAVLQEREHEEQQ